MTRAEIEQHARALPHEEQVELAYALLDDVVPALTPEQEREADRRIAAYRRNPSVATGPNSRAVWKGRQERPFPITEGELVHGGRRDSLDRMPPQQDARTPGASVAHELAAGGDTEATLDFRADRRALLPEMQLDGGLDRGRQDDAFLCRLGIQIP